MFAQVKSDDSVRELLAGLLLCFFQVHPLFKGTVNVYAGTLLLCLLLDLVLGLDANSLLLAGHDQRFLLSTSYEPNCPFLSCIFESGQLLTLKGRYWRAACDTYLAKSQKSGQPLFASASHCAHTAVVKRLPCANDSSTAFRGAHLPVELVLRPMLIAHVYQVLALSYSSHKISNADGVEGRPLRDYPEQQFRHERCC
jgi:hypothetical protein